MWLCLVVAAALRPEVIEDLEPSSSALAGSERPRRRFFSRFDEADDCREAENGCRAALTSEIRVENGRFLNKTSALT